MREPPAGCGGNGIILAKDAGGDNRGFDAVTRQSKHRFARANAARGVCSGKRVYLAGPFWGRRCVHGHERPCWRAPAAPGSAYKRQGAARGRRFTEAGCQPPALLPVSSYMVRECKNTGISHSMTVYYETVRGRSGALTRAGRRGGGAAGKRRSEGRGEDAGCGMNEPEAQWDFLRVAFLLQSGP